RAGRAHARGRRSHRARRRVHRAHDAVYRCIEGACRMNRQLSFPGGRRQHGVVLAVVLILLLVMTVLAIASLSGTLMEERMSTAQRSEEHTSELQSRENL